MLPVEFTGILSFNRDEVRESLVQALNDQQLSKATILQRATAMMEKKLLDEMRQAISTRSHFVLETPLSHGDYWRYLDLFEANRYQLQLNYLGLDKVSDCIARVGQRVSEGGHFVEPGTIKGVYLKNLEHINNYYLSFDLIEFYDGMKVPVMLARVENHKVTWASDQSLKKSWVKQGLPNIAQLITSFKHQSQTRVRKLPKKGFSLHSLL